MERQHIDHRGCECGPCSHHADSRTDALAILRDARRRGGDSHLLGAIYWHVEDAVPLERRIAMQQRFGSIMRDYQHVVGRSA